MKMTRFAKLRGEWLAMSLNVDAEQVARHKSEVQKEWGEEDSQWIPNNIAAAAPEMLDALEICDHVFRSLSERGMYPEELLPDSKHFIGVQGFKFLQDALRKAQGGE